MAQKKSSYYIVSNWKMYLDYADALTLLKKLEKGYANRNGIVQVICPPAVLLHHAKTVSPSYDYGVQDVSRFPAGGYTGDLSAQMCKQAGAQYAIIGHSERRTYYKDDDSIVQQKLSLALQAKLIPILCIGESDTQRKAGSVSSVLKRQLKSALAGISLKKTSTLLIAYEPIWAIKGMGVGRPVTEQQLSDAVHLIYSHLEKLFSSDIITSSVKILYGGSVDSKNIKKYVSVDGVHGALVGSASTNAREYQRMVTALHVV